MDGFRLAAAGVIQARGFQVVQNDPPKKAAYPLLQVGPSGLLGLVIGERDLRTDTVRRVLATRIMVLFLVLFSVAVALAVLGVTVYTGTWLWPAADVLAVLMVVGAVVFARHRNAFDSEVAYVYYNARDLNSLAGVSRPLPTGGSLLSDVRLEVVVCAGRVASENYATRFSGGRRFVSILEAPPGLAPLPHEILRVLMSQ
ncbi:MAG TPA: hypothetical protein VFF67_01020 [Thermoplasmata archaeon]|nr:hypothetical protein [Thermoplasmata archaeon]